MRAVYSALTGAELCAALAKRVVNLLLTIPGLQSRLITFPKVEAEINIRIRCYDKEELTAAGMDEFVERLVADGLEIITQEPVRDEKYRVTLSESAEPPDAIRRSVELPVTRPTEVDGRIVDLPADPLPGKENLSNIQQFGAPGIPLPGTDAPGSGRGRVIEVESSGIGGNASVIRPKLKGDPNASHFQIRYPPGGKQ